MCHLLLRSSLFPYTTLFRSATIVISPRKWLPICWKEKLFLNNTSAASGWRWWICRRRKRRKRFSVLSSQFLVLSRQYRKTRRRKGISRDGSPDLGATFPVASTRQLRHGRRSDMPEGRLL